MATFMRFFATVSFHVPFQIILINGRVVTLGTSIVLFTYMDHHMSGQPSFISRTKSTVRTNARLLASMFEHVHSKIVFVFVFVLALVAFVRLASPFVYVKLFGDPSIQNTVTK